MTRRAAAVALLAAGAWLVPMAGGAAVADSTWADHWRAALAAHAAGDVAGFRAQLLRVRDLIGETPGVTYQLARADARGGDAVGAIAKLHVYAAAGLVRDLAADSDLVALRGIPEFDSLAVRIRDHARPAGRADTAHVFADAALLPEDLAWYAAGRRWFVSSIHRGTIVTVDAQGREQVWARARHGRAVFALALDATRGRLWATEAATPTCEGYDAADSGGTALLAFALADGRLVAARDVPRDGRAHLLGDLGLGPDGSVYASDGLGGGVFRARPGADSLETLAPAGTFGSPQSPAVAADGLRLYVADYPRGVAIVDLATRRVRWLGFAPGVALLGIDGLLRDGRDLIAVQNGIEPRRVVRLALDRAGERVTGWRTLVSGRAPLGEPNHAVRAGGRLALLAHTGWDRVGDDQRLTTPPGATPPRILLTHLTP